MLTVKNRDQLWNPTLGNRVWATFAFFRYLRCLLDFLLPGERDNARNNVRCTQARKTTHGLDGQHQNVDRTPRGRVNQNDRGGDKWRKYVHGVANPRIEDDYRTEHNIR